MAQTRLHLAAGYCARPSKQPQRSPLPAAATSQSQGISSQRVLQLLDGSADMYNKGCAAQLAAAVDDLIASNASARPGPESLAHGQGTWEVFYAPHIAGLSAALGARFQPIRYILRGKEIISNVRYQHPLLGSGWLSASGTLSAPDDVTLLLHFDRFWVDLGADALRPELPASPPSGGGGGGMQRLIDEVVGALGRAAFLAPLARFPVQQLDGDAGLAVFRFPPLSSSIAVRRVVGSGGEQPVAAGGGAARG